MSAPALIRVEAISTPLGSLTVRWRGAAPLASVRLTSAPILHRKSTAPAFPASTAACKAVRISGPERRLMSAPYSNSARETATHSARNRAHTPNASVWFTDAP